ncbi:MAG TPA: FGGY family carbohydrate kinase, partial [Verrucomicrobiaceae bacterium]
KCALLKGGRVVGKIVHAKYPTRIDGPRVEVDPAVVLKAISQATRDVGIAARKADAIALSVFSPGWVAMDARGRALTPIVTHQDRRSVHEAQSLEQKVGEKKYLHIAGTRPFPGGISSTTWAWYLKHEPARVKKADLVGHLNTFLHRQFTGSRVIDTANASFMGIFATNHLKGWSDVLCDAVGARESQLPEILDADQIGGKLTRLAAAHLGLIEGTPMTVGVVDGSAAMLATGARTGQLLNVCGSTDVLALCTDRFSPHPNLLTRALGIGRAWLSVSTIAAAGSAISWARDQLFPDHDWPRFQKLVIQLARQGAKANGANGALAGNGSVRFEPYLAGDRMSIEQRQGVFTGLTLATTREQMLTALLEALAKTSAARVALLKKTGAKIRRDVVITGGAGKLTAVFHRDWPGKWSFRQEEEATLRGLSRLEPKER